MSTCQCGISASGLFTSLSRLRDELKKDKPDLWTAIDLHEDATVGQILRTQVNCGLDLEKEKDMLSSAGKLIKNKEFPRARDEVIKADQSMWSKLLKCSDAEGGT